MNHVRSMRAWGLALVAMFLFSAVAASNASAAEWKLNGAAIGAPVAVSGSGTLELTDEAGGAFGEEVTVRCTGTTTGTAGSGTADKTETVKVNSCETVKGICGEPVARAVDLPWTTKLEGAEPVRDLITNGGAGAPGYAVECTVLGIRATDTCTSETGKPLVETGLSPVPVVFDAGSGTANCTRGGAGKGHVRGTVKISSGAGTLTVN